MKNFTFIFIALFLTACGDKPQTGEKPLSQSIFVLFENGGTVPEEEKEDALNTAFHLFQQLTDLDRRKATRNTQIQIILSALPNRIAWSGTPRQLLAQAKEVRELIAFKPSFSDLVMAFEEIETTINLTQPDNIRLYWIGSTIHVPFQNTDSEIKVEVPQAVPDALALPSFADQLSVLKVFRVHPDQDQILQAYLASRGILKRARNGTLDFALLGAAQTKSNLSDLL
ncbi:MAG: hypothetical protein KZQ86_00510 [Candidatus Thiodiazotropha sp. (ex Lucinoma kastoroae)]|nr:hypothetical protein [Candidatus Thiodiazotropha sp. (ex Lucinoma kastoroae)]